MVVVIQDLTNVLSNNLVDIGFALGSFALSIVYYLLQRQIAQRRRAEIELQQKTKRERLVNQNRSTYPPIFKFGGSVGDDGSRS